MRNELKIGILSLVLYIILERFTSTPDFVLGMLIGLSIAYNLLALLPDSAYNKVKAWKK